MTTNPQICVLEVAAIVPHHMRTITLLHDGNLLDDFLEIRIHGNLFDGKDLARLLVDGLVNAAIRPVIDETWDTKNVSISKSAHLPPFLVSFHSYCRFDGCWPGWLCQCFIVTYNWSPHAGTRPVDTFIWCIVQHVWQVSGLCGPWAGFIPCNIQN